MSFEDHHDESQVKLLGNHDALDIGYTKKRAGLGRSFIKVAFTLATILFISLISVWLLRLRITKNPIKCQNLRVRREWRQLDRNERMEYIGAVKCLHSTPSRLSSHVNVTLYDDFVWVHQKNSMYTHQTAAFLSWHRHFLHLFEETIRSSCGYEGSLPYWDWSLDWKDPASSPIWDSETGFGGNGHYNASNSPYNCVVDGPFSNFEVQYLREKLHPHCLARQFESDNGTDHFSGYKARPDSIKHVLGQADFKSFLKALERGPHDILPYGVRGDFGSFTAPNDPVFYLHHTQLDRLWWMWQQIDSRRLSEYSGPTMRGSKDVSAEIHDVLPMFGLDEDVIVQEIMVTESSPLCYGY